MRWQSFAALFALAAVFRPGHMAAGDSEDQIVAAASNGLSLWVAFSPHYSSPDAVQLKYRLENHAAVSFMLHRIGPDPFALRLVSPAGIEMPDEEKNRIGKSVSFGPLYPGETDAGTINLTSRFHFAEVGRYRCFLTYEAFEATDMTKDGMHFWGRGAPVILRIPEITFTVVNVPVASAPSNSNDPAVDAQRRPHHFKPVIQQNAKPPTTVNAALKTSLRWIAIASGLLAALGLTLYVIRLTKR